MAYRTIKENRIKKLMERVTVDPESGCWNWDKPIQCGYGRAQLNGTKTLAHRVVYQLIKGDIPEGLDLDHLCRNRACVNPDHLEPVTRSENLRRGFISRGCKNGHPFNEDDFSVVHRSNGSNEWRCKVCHRERNRKAKQAKRLRSCAR